MKYTLPKIGVITYIYYAMFIQTELNSQGEKNALSYFKKSVNEYYDWLMKCINDIFTRV